ncbi:TadE/TadG family type IV pilus assembly protein [Desulfovibrio psychrotolerans]|uniref:Pilus biosynthesis protein TadE n=1 Tax=Desulfovibrio psychrotolerans TaxID=415242 RepID=A0A7J0BTE5_9BACT|nr:TadE/TadG family type IV pilus assembly protein [Desulfovibrio psychrotolerans]GFM36993.1 pilus biosynthesis protein TadE [Desulfovibrio psychrotolerans]
MKNFRTSENGMAAVEIALLLPVLALVLYVVVEGANTLHNYATISEASRSAARQVVISGDPSTARPIVEAVVTELPVAALTTTVSMDAGASSVTVEVRYAYQSVFLANRQADGPLPSLYTLSAKTTMPVP